MDLLRKNWYDLGAFHPVIVSIYIFLSHSNFTNYKTLMWLSLVSLFLHQLEEYRVAGHTDFFGVKWFIPQRANHRLT